MQSVQNVPLNVLPVVNKRHVQLLMPYLLLYLNVAVAFVVVVGRDRLNEDQELNGVKKAFVMCYKMPVAKCKEQNNI